MDYAVERNKHDIKFEIKTKAYTGIEENHTNRWSTSVLRLLSMYENMYTREKIINISNVSTDDYIRLGK